MTTEPLPVKMTTTEAKQITTKIGLRLETIVTNSEVVIELIEQARAGSAHEALGYPSWTAYVSAKFGGSLARLQKAERVPIVAMLAETGMSVRAIAAVTETSKSTIDREVSHVGTPATGTDGKTYPRPATFLRSGAPDAQSTEEIGNAIPPIRPKPRRSPLPDAYFTTVHDLELILQRLARLHRDDRFPANRTALKERHWRELCRAATWLEDLNDDLWKPLSCTECEGTRDPSPMDDELCVECRKATDPRVVKS